MVVAEHLEVRAIFDPRVNPIIAVNEVDEVYGHAIAERGSGSFGRKLVAFPRVAQKLVMMVVETMLARQLASGNGFVDVGGNNRVRLNADAGEQIGRASCRERVCELV